MSLVVLTGTALAWSAETDFDKGFTRSAALGNNAPRSLGGALNILLIGLDTRKDQNGNDLPKAILSQLHAGDGEEGGYNANSLILVHIPSDMKRITAFSIPRDDYVPVSGIPGYDHAKIKESYGLKKAAVQQKLINSGVTDQVDLEHQGREAGRASVVQTVRNLVGVPIDRFAEVSLSGFYDLANELGGVDVCLNHAVKDKFYSGANFPAGRQHLNGAQALAFVRQRHGLDNGDLDRTHRQQAFITSVAKALRSSGTLTDVRKLSGLMDVAHRDIVLSDGWNLIDFGRTMGSAGAMPIEFRTLPVLGYEKIDGQEVNTIDAAAIKREVRASFSDQPAAKKSTAKKTMPTSTVDVLNASGVSGRAGKVSAALTAQGYKAGKVGNATASDQSSSSIEYGSGAQADAKQLSKMLGDLPVSAGSSATAGHIQVVLGSDFSMPTELAAAASSDGAVTTVADAPAPDSGKPVGTTINSDTIPCVN